MAGNPKKKSTGIVNAAIGALAVVLAILIVWMMNLVAGIQGTARIIKLEISGQPQDGMIADIDAFIDGLRFGSDELSLVRLNNDAFQSKMQELDDYFQALKQEIGRVRAVGSNNTDIIPISEEALGLIGYSSEKKGLVFKGLMRSWTQIPMKEWIRSAGITKNITFHTSRRTFATLQAAAGTDIRTIQSIMAHKSITTTQRYIKVVDANKREASKKITLTRQD